MKWLLQGVKFGRKALDSDLEYISFIPYILALIVHCWSHRELRFNYECGGLSAREITAKGPRQTAALPSETVKPTDETVNPSGATVNFAPAAVCSAPFFGGDPCQNCPDAPSL